MECLEFVLDEEHQEESLNIWCPFYLSEQHDCVTKARIDARLTWRIPQLKGGMSSMVAGTYVTCWDFLNYSPVPV